MFVVLLAPLAAAAEIRQPHVAGQFYPADPTELRQVITGFLQRQPDPSPLKPRALIVPHAGYEYSGPVAGAAFRAVQGHEYDAAVIVGFSHRAAFEGISVDQVDTYRTPLGLVPVDLSAVKQLQELDRALAQTEENLLHHNPQAHEEPEHSLEVMLPFLQVSLDQLRIVPVIIGEARPEQLFRLGKLLAEFSRQGDYLFVFSTDLSHYHSYDEAVQIDQRTVDALLSETPQAVERLFANSMIEACGRGPILTGLMFAVKRGYLKRQLLGYATSANASGDRSRVVGYAAIGLYDGTAPPARLISEDAGLALVKAARLALEQALEMGQSPEVASILQPYPELQQAAGLFVTLRRGGELRGCIGRIQTSEPLASSLPVVALEAALKDPRFNPVEAHELQDIHIEVSVLTLPQPLHEPRDVLAGRDGVVLDYRGHQGVFLPTVWEETGWLRIEFLRQLASQKAGLDPDAWRQATLSAFQDQVFEEPAIVPTH